MGQKEDYLELMFIEAKLMEGRQRDSSSVTDLSGLGCLRLPKGAMVARPDQEETPRPEEKRGLFSYHFDSISFVDREGSTWLASLRCPPKERLEIFRELYPALAPSFHGAR